MVLYATVRGITTIINGNLVEAAPVDGIVHTAVDQFLRGARPLDQPGPSPPTASRSRS